MKCNKCGEEFGKGETCQNCGADKVSALGEFSGYSTPKARSANGTKATSSPSAPSLEPVTSQICWKCGEIIPMGKFCPVCGQALVRECPKCKKEYSTQYDICPHCGTNYIVFQEQQERLRIQRENEQRAIREREETFRQQQKEVIESAGISFAKIFCLACLIFAFWVVLLLILGLSGVGGEGVSAISFFIVTAIVLVVSIRRGFFKKDSF